MISFKFKSVSKRVKIKCQKLDERMSQWLQKVFNIKNQIIGFRSNENKYYDVETFYSLIEKFFGNSIEIVEANDQMEISFTSDNLNSSSFIRPSQPNTSEINPKNQSDDSFQEFITISDLKHFEKKLTEGKEVSILFNINSCFRKQILENGCDYGLNYATSSKINNFMLINTLPPKKSSFNIYMGKIFLISIPLTNRYQHIIKDTLQRLQKAPNHPFAPDYKFAKQPPQEDQAPSFTTYHLQERLNQDAITDYLARMLKEKLLRNFQYEKLTEKLDQNYLEFYKIFCEGVIDNDYESFKNEMMVKVENNLQLILSNVEEMDFSRPISREEQRRHNLKRSVKDIEIVKVQNYFEILEQLQNTDAIRSKVVKSIKQQLLDANQEVCGYFAKFLSRDLNQNQLAAKLNNYSSSFSNSQFQQDDLKVPAKTTKSRSNDFVRKSEPKASRSNKFDMDIQNYKIEEAPMFGSNPNQSNQPETNFSPIKYMSNINSNYKKAWDKLSSKADYFAADEYGLLYHYLEIKDDCISNLIQDLDWNQNDNSSLQELKSFLREKNSKILAQNLDERELQHFKSIKETDAITHIYDNFKYQSDLNIFLNQLKEEIQKTIPLFQRTLHKKSSDSQLLEKEKQIKKYGKRKYSDQNQERPPISPSPKNSQNGLENLEALKNPWASQFEEMLQFCNFNEQKKNEYLRDIFSENDPSLFVYLRQYINAKQKNQELDETFKAKLEVKQNELKQFTNIIPMLCALLRKYEEQNLLSSKIRQWAIFQFTELNHQLIAFFQLYLQIKDQEEFIENICLLYQKQSQEIQFFNIYLQRIQKLLRQMSVNDEISMEVFRFYPEKIRSLCELYYFNGDFEDLMENLDLLQITHQKSRQINFVSLNFSGINTNPFQYDDGGEVISEMNTTFKNLFKLQFFNEKSLNNSAKIDKAYKNNRLSIGYTSEFDLIEGKLPNKKQFETLWFERFQQEKIKIKLSQPPSLTDLETVCAIDYLFYKSALIYVFKISYELTQETFDLKIKELSGEDFLQFLEEKFHQPSCQLSDKQSMVMEYIFKKNIDVLCMQEAGSVEWNQELIKEYGLVKNHDSVIIYKKSKVGELKSNLQHELSKELDFNEDTACFFTTRDYLIISGHLKSGKQHLEQAKEMFETLNRVKEIHPLLKIMIGIDSNHFIARKENQPSSSLEKNSGNQNFSIIPPTTDKSTTIKKRSCMQFQFSKAGKEVSEVKDHVITTGKIEKFKIERIDGEESQDELLPNDIHPYDHYALRAVIKFD